MKKETKSEGKEKITADMSFSEVLQKYPETADVFFKHGMSCFGCPAAMMESIGAGIMAHGEDVKGVIDELNKKVSKKK